LTADVDTVVIDQKRPWPGLMSFDESAQNFFFGRDQESLELLRLIKRNTLTVLFGQSGLGKSSLLAAGVFPRLRSEDYLPIRVRLEVSALAMPFNEQVAAAIRDNCQRHRIEAPDLAVDMTLWEYFHRVDTDFWTPSNRLLKPVLVFDQFEELFTLGHHDPSLRSHCLDFLADIGDLIENRMPPGLRRLFESDDASSSHIDFERSNYRVVFCFREDYLAEFEGLKKLIRCIMHNRMRLMPMSTGNAISAVQNAGGNHITTNVAQEIVSFVGGATTGDDAMDDMQVEPALLSLVCRELNEERLRRNEEIISTELIRNENTSRIIENYYHGCFAELPSQVKRFVEDRLLTKSGFRDSCAIEEALDLPGIREADTDLLVQRRLLRYDIRYGVRRVELTHDVLTSVARRSRDERHANERAEAAIRQAAELQREAQRLKALHADARHYFGLALAEKAERAFLENRSTEGMLYATHALANLDRDRAPREFLMSLGRRLSMMQGRKNAMTEVINSLRFVPGGHRLAVQTNRSIAVFDAELFDLQSGMKSADTGLAQFDFSGDGRFVAARTRAGQPLLWRQPNGRQLIPAQVLTGVVTCFAFSVTGRLLALGFENGGVRILDLSTGRELGTTRAAQSFALEFPPIALAWSPDELSLLTFSQKSSWVWTGSAYMTRRELHLGAVSPVSVRQSLNHGQLAILARSRMVFCYSVNLDAAGVRLEKVNVVTGNAEDLHGAAISPDGSLLALSWGTKVRLSHWASGRELAVLQAGSDAVLSVDFSSDGAWLAAGARSGEVLRWRLPQGDWEQQAITDERAMGFKLDGVNVRSLTQEEIEAQRR
jgi:hypothetical protein